MSDTKVYLVVKKTAKSSVLLGVYSCEYQAKVAMFEEYSVEGTTISVYEEPLLGHGDKAVYSSQGRSIFWWEHDSK